MKNELEAIVLELINDRVSEIPTTQLKIDVFINAEARKGAPDSFRNIFLTKAIDALSAVLSKRVVSILHDNIIVTYFLLLFMYRLKVNMTMFLS